MKGLAVTAISVLAGLPSQAVAVADGPDFLRVVGVREGSALSLRDGPGLDAGRIALMPAGTDGLRNLGCRGGPSLVEWQAMTVRERAAARRQRWCNVEFRGLKGWAAGWYLGEGSAP